MKRTIGTTFLAILGIRTLEVAARAVARNSSTEDTGVCQTAKGAATYSLYVADPKDVPLLGRLIPQRGRRSTSIG